MTEATVYNYETGVSVPSADVVAKLRAQFTNTVEVAGKATKTKAKTTAGNIRKK